MQQRTELALAAGLIFSLGLVAGLLGVQRARLSDSDPRRSIYLSGPSGASGYAEALRRLGVRIQTFRRPVASFDTSAAPRTLIAFLDPTRALDAREGRAISGLRTDLLVAGSGAIAALRCLGWELRPLTSDSPAIVPPPGAEPRRFPRPRAVLARRVSPVAVDSTDTDDGTPIRCTAPAAARTDTLLRETGGRPLVVGETLGDGRRVTLVADGRLFTNRALRETAAGPFALGLVAGYSRVIVDEYHHGYDTSRTLSGAALDWTRRSPWGWAILQLCAVGVIALLAAGVRFGPVRPGIERRRRSPLEHVRALATALAAARGHDVAVRLILQGLRRRLSPPGRGVSGEIGPWLEGLAPAVRTPAGRAALETLTSITHRAASAQDVLRAADAVETLWEELTPT